VTFTEKQLALRSKGIGGSEIAAVLGLNPKVTPFDVWARKVGALEEQEHDRDPVGNLPAYLGTRLEPVVADVYAARHPEILLVGSDTYQHPEFPWAIVTPDREAYRVPAENPAGMAGIQPSDRDHLVEIKTKSWRTAREFGESGTDELPADVLCQAQWQALIVGVALVRVAVLIDGRDYREYEVQADKDLHAIMLEKGGEFWNGYVLPRVEPPLVGRAAKQYLAQKFRMHGQEILRADPMADDTLRRLLNVRAELTEAEARKEALENALKALIGTNKGIQGEVAKVTWSQTKDAEIVDWKAVASRYRHIIESQEWETDVQSEIDGIVADHTTIRAGSRRFLFQAAKED